jgi:site-specific recombinase XerD
VAKVSIVPWSSKKTADGTVPLYLVIRHKNQRSTVALPVRIKEKDWNALRGEVRKTHPDHYRLNLRLTEMLQKAQASLQDALFEDSSISPQIIKAAIMEETGSGGEDFLAYYESKLEVYRDRRQWGTFEAYRVALNKLRDYTRRSTGRTKLEFHQLTVPFIEGFRTYLISHCGNSKNTVHKNLGSIRAILYAAIREGRFPQEKNPFFQIRMEKGKRTKNKSIDIEDVWKIEDAELGEGRINDVRNCFLFAFYNAGMRVSDVLQLQGRDIVQRRGVWRVEYEMEKTGVESFSMPLLPTPERILRYYGWPDVESDQYIFPFLPQHLLRGTRETFDYIKKKTSLLNKYLKKIQEACGIETRLTTHVARHALSHQLDRTGFDLGAIQDVLKHGDRSTTEVYIRRMRAGRFDEKLISALERSE